MAGVGAVDDVEFNNKKSNTNRGWLAYDLGLPEALGRVGFRKNTSPTNSITTTPAGKKETDVDILNSIVQGYMVQISGSYNDRFWTFGVFWGTHKSPESIPSKTARVPFLAW